MSNSLRKKVLDELHEGQGCIVKMKAVTRMRKKLLRAIKKPSTFLAIFLITDAK